MQITILADDAAAVMRRVALVVLVGVAFIRIPLFGDPYQPVRTVLLALVTAAALAFVSPRQIPRPRNWAVGLLGGLLLWVSLASLAAHPASSVWGVHGRYQGLVALFAVASFGLAGFILFQKDVRWLARAAALGSGVQGILVLAQSTAGAIPTGTLGNQALAGAWLSVTVAIAVAGARVERGHARIWLMSGALIGAAGLGVTGSRAAWLGLVLALAALGILAGMRRAVPALALTLVLLVGALAAGGEAVMKLSPASLVSGSAASRVEIWKGAGRMIGEHPWFGVGAGRFLYEFPRFQTLEHARTEGPDVRPDVAHSHLLQLAAEAGVPAALLAIALALGVLAGGASRARRGDATALVAVTGLIAYLGQGLFGIGAVETDAIGWVLGGVALARMTQTDAASDHGSPASRPQLLAGLALGTSLSIALLSAYYLVGDRHHGRGLDAFYSADFASAWELQTRAAEHNPLVDSYRVAAADAATFIRGDAIPTAMSTVERGLELEPGSYDLAVSRAALLRAGGADSGTVADAYLDALELYPLSAAGRLAAARALRADGRNEQAAVLAAEVLELYPEDESLRSEAISIVGEVFSGSHQR